MKTLFGCIMILLSIGYDPVCFSKPRKGDIVLLPENTGKQAKATIEKIVSEAGDKNYVYLTWKNGARTIHRKLPLLALKDEGRLIKVKNSRRKQQLFNIDARTLAHAERSMHLESVHKAKAEKLQKQVDEIRMLRGICRGSACCGKGKQHDRASTPIIPKKMKKPLKGNPVKHAEERRLELPRKAKKGPAPVSSHGHVNVNSHAVAVKDLEIVPPLIEDTDKFVVHDAQDSNMLEDAADAVRADELASLDSTGEFIVHYATDVYEPTDSDELDPGFKIEDIDFNF